MSLADPEYQAGPDSYIQIWLSREIEVSANSMVIAYLDILSCNKEPKLGGKCRNDFISWALISYRRNLMPALD